MNYILDSDMHEANPLLQRNFISQDAQRLLQCLSDLWILGVTRHFEQVIIKCRSDLVPILVINYPEGSDDAWKPSEVQGSSNMNRFIWNIRVNHGSGRGRQESKKNNSPTRPGQSC